MSIMEQFHKNDENIYMKMGLGEENLKGKNLTSNRLIQILMKDMSEEDAYEYFSFNIESAWVGDNTPAFTCDLVNFFEA